MKKLILFMFLVFSFVTIILFYLASQVNKEIQVKSEGLKYVSCYKESSSSDSLPALQWSSNDDDERHIFFIETSCEEQTELSCREACAVESAALTNPKSIVHLLFVSPSPPSCHTTQLLSHLRSYENLKINRINVDEFVKNSPIEQWFGSGLFKDSPWPAVDMSDILRTLTIWKFGGIYLDLDVIVLKPLDDLNNFAVLQDSDYVGSAVIGFNKEDSGRRMANDGLDDMMKNLNHNEWGSIGPNLLTRIFQKLCNVTNVNDMADDKCQGFRILPPSAFYPIPYGSWQNYFTSDKINETMKLIARARGIHVWNKLSGNNVLRTDQQVPYTLVAQKKCPLVFHHILCKQTL